jgi:glucosamine--fructose-6-phosphate aminotransferase (isomerizing)
MINTDATSGYVRDILDQPVALEATRLELRQEPALHGLPERLAAGDFRLVLLTGMGSSYHALQPLFYALAGRGLPVLLLETGELVHHTPNLLDARTLVVAVSQSGRSAEIVRLLDAAAARGTPVLGVTNTPGSPLQQLSTAHLLTRAGEENTVSCKTYLCALLALRWLAGRLNGESSAALDAESAGLPAAVQAYLAAWQSHAASLAGQLAGVEHLFWVGRAASLAACGTGGLITKESTHVHAEGMSSAALRHGPLEMLGPGCFVGVFAGEQPTRALNRRLFDELGGYAIPAAWIDSGPGAGPWQLPAVPAALRPILEILPVEMATLALAALRGHRAGDFSRGGKVTLTE